MHDSAAGRKAKAYSYLRFSSPEQAKGASRARQIEAAAKWAAERDLALDEELRDEGVSAFRGRHRSPTSALGGFLARVDRGEVAEGSYLIVESLDRLSREEVLDALTLFLGLIGKGITIVTLADDHEWSRATLRENQMQLVISIVIMSRAYEESATKSRRVGDAWSRKRVAAHETKQAMTAVCPAWIRLVGGPRTGRYELIEERAAIVRGIFADTIAGDGRRTIAKRFNAAKLDCWGGRGAKGKRWWDSYIQSILTSPAAFGRWERGDERIEGYFPAVVDEDTYWRARAASSERLTAQGRPATDFANLLQGLARCATCGGTMGFFTRGKYTPRLRCLDACSGGECTNRAMLPYRGIDEILAYSYAHFADAALFALEADARAAAAEIEALEQRRRDAIQRRDRLIALVEAGEPIPVVRIRLDELAVAIGDLERAIREANLRAGREADQADDIEMRLAIVENLIFAADPVERARGRAKLNARLRLFLDGIVVQGKPRLSFHFKPQYQHLDTHMTSIYGPRPPIGQASHVRDAPVATDDVGTSPPSPLGSGADGGRPAPVVRPARLLESWPSRKPPRSARVRPAGPTNASSHR